MPALAAPSRERSWTHRSGRFDLQNAPLLVGILNVTPDSFSDGGRHARVEDALAAAHRMVAEGAGMLDIGGESTRPGARPVAVEEELARVLPVIRRLRVELPTPLSIDTRRAEVARAALEEGVEVVNDISALADPAMASLIAEYEAGVVLMHMQGTPATMQRDPHYEAVVPEVAALLRERVAYAQAAGIAPERIVIDPGIGFGKTKLHNLELLARVEEFEAIGVPLLLGVSRKAFLGELAGGVPPEGRAVATAAACVAALLQGVRIFRVHDVGSVREALAVGEAIRRARHPRD